MSEWLNFVKSYAAEHKISHKQALRDASPSYKQRSEVKTEVMIPKKVSEKIKKEVSEKSKRSN